MLREMYRVLKATGKGWRFALFLLLRSPFDILLVVTQVLFLQRAFDSITQGNAQGGTDACLLFGVASIGLFLYNGTVWGAYAPFVTKLEATLRIKLFDKITALPFERIESISQGEWVTRLNTDVELPFSRPLHLPHAACASVSLFACVVILWRINPAVLGWVLLFVVPHVIVSQWWIARAMPRLNQKVLEKTAQNTADLAAIITCAEIAALYDGQEYLINHFKQSSLQLLQSNMRVRMRMAIGEGILPLFGLGGYLTLLIISSGWIADGQFTFGGLTAAFQYRGGLLAASLMLIRCLITIQEGAPGMKRLNDILKD